VVVLLPCFLDATSSSVFLDLINVGIYSKDVHTCRVLY
jgi:hypothetical protein